MDSSEQLPAIIEPGALTPLPDGHLIPVLIAEAGDQAAWRYVGPEGPSVRKRTLASCTQCSGGGPSDRELSIQLEFNGSAWP